MNSGNRAAVLLALGAIWLGAVEPATGQTRQPTEHTVRIVSDLDAFRMYFSPRILRIEPGERGSRTTAIETSRRENPAIGQLNHVGATDA